ncbi:MAG: hypothetical protein JWP32_1846 [Schumannella sp.]|nr:hypothetical protein [Schumannella sp.]
MVATAAPAVAGISAIGGVGAVGGVDDFAFESLDVQYYLDRDDGGHSTLRTVETFVADFPESDQNRGIVRNIPITYGGTDALDPRRVDTRLHIDSVTDEHGDPVYWEQYDAGEGIYGMYIDDDTFKHGPTTYVIEYTQHDVTRYFENTDDDEFYWDVNGTDWAQTFGTVSATVHVSPGLTGALTGDASCYRGAYGSGTPCDIGNAGGTFTLSEPDIGARQNVTFSIGFTAGTFTPGQTVEQDPIVRILPWALLLILGAIVVAIVVLRRTIWAHAPGQGIVVPQYEGPEVLGVLPSAAFLGTPNRGLPAQFVEFAVAGIARLVDDPEERESRRYRLELLDRGRAVERDDELSMRKLFGKDGEHQVLVLDRNNRKLGDRIASLLKQNAAVPRDRGLVVKGTSRLTKLLRWPAFACFVTGWVIVFWAANAGVANGLLTLQLVGIIVGSLIVIGFGGVPERRTRLGSEVREHLQGLKEYLALAEADRLRVLQSPEGAQRTRVDPDDPAAVVKLYEKLLPWAIVWGVESEWSKVLGEHYTQTQTEPSNLQLSSGFSGLTAFATSVQSTSFAQTVSTSSYSGSGGGSSFSGGSSGGGFSGGGGGGGGGGGR